MPRYQTDSVIHATIMRNGTQNAMRAILSFDNNSRSLYRHATNTLQKTPMNVITYGAITSACGDSAICENKTIACSASNDADSNSKHRKIATHHHSAFMAVVKRGPLRPSSNSQSSTATARVWLIRWA